MYDIEEEVSIYFHVVEDVTEFVSVYSIVCLLLSMETTKTGDLCL